MFRVYPFKLMETSIIYDMVLLWFSSLLALGGGAAGHYFEVVYLV